VAYSSFANRTVSAYVVLPPCLTSAYVSIRQHTRQHTCISCVSALLDCFTIYFFLFIFFRLSSLQHYSS
jgi:hypothetical protein